MSEPLAERLRLPFTVILAIMGALIGAVALTLSTSGLGDTLSPVVRRLLDLPIRSNVFLYILLPTLLFQVALVVNARRMLDDWVPILLMAVGAVLVSTVVIGYALTPFTSLPLAACLLIGAVVSTTDPSAVVSIFRNIAAPQRLTRIVEGESLLNDAAAIALFGFFLDLCHAGRAQPDPARGGPDLSVVDRRRGGAGLGLCPRCHCTYGGAANLSARASVGQRGLALPDLYCRRTICRGLWRYCGGRGRAGAELDRSKPPDARKLGLPTRGLGYSGLLGGGVHLHSGRAAYSAPDGRPAPKRSVADRGDRGCGHRGARGHAVRGFYRYWAGCACRHGWTQATVRPSYGGGLRGAVTLALALAVTESALVPPAIKREVGILATGFTLFTLLVQGTTLRWMIARLGLNRLPALDEALSRQVIAVALQNVREAVSDSARDYQLTPDVIRSEAKRFAGRLDGAVADAESVDIPDRDRITLGLVALAGRERDLIIEHFRQQLFSSRLVERMLSDVDGLIERTRLGGRNEYRSTARRALGFGGRYRVAVWLNNRLRWSRPLEAMTADRFELLLNQQLVLQELHGFIAGKIRRIHGRRVADLLHELLRRRAEETASAIEGLRLQYPGYAEEIERRFLRRTSLRLEEREYETLFADGLIGRELHATLRTKLDAARKQLDERPRLDFALQREEFLRAFPVFDNMPADAHKRLARALTTYYVEPGKVLIRKGGSAALGVFHRLWRGRDGTPRAEIAAGPGRVFLAIWEC